MNKAVNVDVRSVRVGSHLILLFFTSVSAESSFDVLLGVAGHFRAANRTNESDLANK